MNNIPFYSGFLSEKDGHKIYYEQYGNPKGVPVIVLHGGPGSKSKSKQVNSFSITDNQVILFDQRGCGKSLPAGNIENNTTQDLIADIERIREVLKIESWYVAGGSWGSTLAIAYAEAHPEKVKGLMISSIFLSRKEDVEWSFTRSGGVDKVFTDLWESRVKFLNNFGANPANAASILLNKIQKNEESEVKEIVAGVMNWEGNLMSSQSDIVLTNPDDVEESNINEVKIFLHYEANKSFLNDNQLLENIHKIKHIPTIIVHGRYDLLCTLDQMWELAQAMPDSEYVILPSSNHRLTADGDIARKYAYKYFLAKNK